MDNTVQDIRRGPYSEDLRWLFHDAEGEILGQSTMEAQLDKLFTGSSSQDSEPLALDSKVDALQRIESTLDRLKQVPQRQLNSLIAWYTDPEHTVSFEDAETAHDAFYFDEETIVSTENERLSQAEFEAGESLLARMKREDDCEYRNSHTDPEFTVSDISEIYSLSKSRIREILHTAGVGTMVMRRNSSGGMSRTKIVRYSQLRTLEMELRGK